MHWCVANFLSVTVDDVEIDFTKIDGFEKLNTQGVFGIDVLNTTEISFETFQDGFLTFSYKFI